MSVCVVCSKPQIAGLAPWHAVCRQCGYESASLQSAINATSAAEAIDEDERERALKDIRQENFREIVAVLGVLAPASARNLLDVGCAHGWFLEIARTRFNVLGIEPDAVVGGRTAARGLPVRGGYFPQALNDSERFDVIVFNDVIEHIPDIASALKACRERLVEDGLLVLNLPNSRGFFYRLSKLFVRFAWRGPFERMWQKGMPSPHVHYFDADNLSRLAGGHGFVEAHRQVLPSLRTKGLLDRIRYAGDLKGPLLYLQYLAVLATVPLLRMLPSDIVVVVFRKQ